VHYLSLAALLVALRAVRGALQQRCGKDVALTLLSQSLGMPLFQLQQMLDWMWGALSDKGLYVMLNEMKQWSHSWESILSA